MAKLLFLGDICGRGGRQWVSHRIPTLRRELELDFVVANGENAAGGFGITADIVQELLSNGVDGITLGNHVWDQRGFDQAIDGLPKVCRPANLPEGCPGRDFLILERNGLKIGVFSVIGRVMMNMSLDCPFKKADKLVSKKQGLNGIFVDIHAEATSEKQAMGWFLDGRVTAVIGTHTHVVTADEKIMPKGTAFQTDAGLCGSHRSIIGCEPDPIIHRFLTGIPCRLTVASGDIRINATLITFDPTTGLATDIQRLEDKQPE
ncbi:MAG: metallophosphoesterase [Verrucomicrobia bacterium GWC2_42_7]|nr:MAG: metallophosphoesterase [Verrucomicrobia bacterium GWC2_42_7]